MIAVVLVLAAAAAPPAAKPIIADQVAEAWNSPPLSLGLTNNPDGSLTVTASLNRTLSKIDVKNGVPQPSQWMLAPTIKFSGSSGLLSFGSSTPAAKASFATGGTSFSAGGTVAWSRFSGLDMSDVRKIVIARTEVIQRLCGEMTPGNKEMCDDNKKVLDEARVKIATEHQTNSPYPILDISLWAGAGASDFNYYEQQGPAGAFAQTDQWHWNWGGAFLLTWLPDGAQGSSTGLTLELPISVQRRRQDSSDTAQACASKGTTADGTPLTSCAAALPFGGPTLGTAWSIEGALGVIDRTSNQWRLAVDAGLTHTTADGTTLGYFKLPIYLNALAFAGGSGAVSIDYAGIIRITPTMQFTSVSGDPLQWKALVTVDLLAQKTLFVRADTLLK